MPSQNSIIKFSGRMGDKVYYYRKDRKNRKHYFVRQAPATVVQTSATKLAAIDFGTASKGSSLLRNALHEYTYDTTLHYRLNKKMGEILRADENHPSGQRVFVPQNMQSLQNFQFNSATGIRITPVIENTETGAISISFADRLNVIGNTTHISIRAIALSVNFTKNTTQQVKSNTVVIKRGERPGPLTLNINRRDLTLIILEIQSFYEVNGQLHISQNRKGQALDIIEVLQPLEQTKEPKRRYQNKAPRFWLPYIMPANHALITRVNCSSLPEG